MSYSDTRLAAKSLDSVDGEGGGGRSVGSRGRGSRRAQMTALLCGVPWHFPEGCLGFVPMAAERDKLQIKSL